MKRYIIIFCLILTAIWLPKNSPKAQDLKLSQWDIAYKRSSLHFLDQQASPNIYQADLNGIALGYAHAGIKSRTYFNFQANTGIALPKGLGVRTYTFTDTDFYGQTTTSTFDHVPTVYVGQLEFGYLRKLKNSGKKAVFAGATFQEWVGYSDNIGMWSTWANSFATLNAAIQLERPIGEKQQLQLKASVPVVAVVSRMPYSNTISDPNKNNATVFFEEGTRFTSLHEFKRINFRAAYQLRLSRHWQTGVAYEFLWLHDTHDTYPRHLKAYSHSVSLQLNYIF